MRKPQSCEVQAPPGRADTPAARTLPTGEVGGPDGLPAFGNLDRLGFTIQWHALTAGAELDWARSFPPGKVGLCLNLAGRAYLDDGRQTVELLPRMSVIYYQAIPRLAGERCAGDEHRFITVEFTPEFLRQHLSDQAPHLHPYVQAVIGQTARESVVSPPQTMSVGQLELLESLRRCPVIQPALETWCRCKALELAAHSLFFPKEGEILCSRQQRAACERAARARKILRQRLADPPSLEELGRLVGCSPFYLSRQFSSATGLTIQQFLRKIRLERAAELLRQGRHNVTEAALEVGYSSLSHFTAAFRESFGCCPGLYPVRTVPQASGAAAQPGEGTPPKH